MTNRFFLTRLVIFEIYLLEIPADKNSIEQCFVLKITSHRIGTSNYHVDLA